MVSRDLKLGRLAITKLSALGLWQSHLLKREGGSIIGHTIAYNGVGILRFQNLTKYPHPHPHDTIIDRFHRTNKHFTVPAPQLIIKTWWLSTESNIIYLSMRASFTLAVSAEIWKYIKDQQN